MSSTITRKCKQCSVNFQANKYEVRRGKAIFCSISCGVRYRNLHNNPTKCKKVREKISRNHADFSGKNNPMYGTKGSLSPNYKGGKIKNYRLKALRVYGEKCNRCEQTTQLEVHHKDRNRRNNAITNLEVLCKNCHIKEHFQEFLKVANDRRCSITGKFKKGAL